MNRVTLFTVRVYLKGQPFISCIKTLSGEIKDRDFNIVGIACATCAAQAQGVTCRLPSHVFGAYRGPALEPLGTELDADVQAILSIAKAGN